jgi:transposase-like protein
MRSHPSTAAKSATKYPVFQPTAAPFVGQDAGSFGAPVPDPYLRVPRVRCHHQRCGSEIGSGTGGQRKGARREPPPPFSPNPNCDSHSDTPGWRFKKEGIFRRARGPRRVQRYLCQHCGRNFSAETFSPTYGLKRPELLRPLFWRVLSCSGFRQIVREFGVHHLTVQRQVERLGRHCILVHEVLRPKGTPLEPLLLVIRSKIRRYMPDRSQEGRSRTASPEVKAALWPSFTAMYCYYDDYQARTDRDIPVVTLSPREAGPREGSDGPARQVPRRRPSQFCPWTWSAAPAPSAAGRTFRGLLRDARTSWRARARPARARRALRRQERAVPRRCALPR